MINTIKETRFNDEIEISLSYDDIENAYILYIDVVYHGEFVFTLLEQEFSSKCNALIAYNGSMNKSKGYTQKFKYMPPNKAVFF